MSADQKVRYTSLEPPESNGCDACTERRNLRLCCPEHRGEAQCPWCLGRGFEVREMRWVRCSHRPV